MAFLPVLLAAAAATPHLSAARASSPPNLDGRLDDAVWQRAATTDAFTQKSPDDGKPPVERTIVRVLYDDHAIYVGIDCIQTGAEVVARLTRRDRNVEADAVSVNLDSRGDGRSAFEFSVNAAGVLSDAIRFNDTDFSSDWDENWEAKTAITSTGWSAELRIPLRILRFRELPVQSFGLQVRRYVSARQELDEWAYISRDTAGEVSHYGKLDGLAGLRSRSPFEVRPFVVGFVRHHDPQGDLVQGFKPGGSAGLDLKWHISQELTLDATFLPDFGQVEADQVFLNLTTFEQYYPEKRPFFLEGADTFATPLQLVYTRRIGRAPDPPSLVTDRPIGERLVDNPAPAPIFGAAKLTGELGGGFSVGELLAVTGARSVDARAANGKEVSRLAAPLTTFKVLRVKKTLGEGAEIGLMALATNHVEPSYAYPIVAPGYGAAPHQLCPGGETLAIGGRCFHDAYVAGVDGRWRSKSGDYVASAQLVASMITNGPPRTLPDGTVIKSGDAGPAASVRFAKEGGKPWIYVVDGEVYGKKVDFNDLGYMQRQNFLKAHAGVEYRTLEPWRATLETHTSIDLFEQDNLALQSQQRRVLLGNFTKFKNFWSIFVGAHYFAPRYDDREVGDGAGLERAGAVGFEAYVGTDSRKRVNGELWTMVDVLENGFLIQGDGRISVRVLPQLDVDLLPTWIYTNGEPRYFGTQGASYLFGRQRAQSVGVTLRSTYTFTPRLTLQAYAQVFLEAEHYHDYLTYPAIGRGTSIRLRDLRPAGFAIAANPDFEGGVFNANLVLRWEYRLGSTLYVVYTHAQSGSIYPSFGDPARFDFRLVRPRAAEDELLAKIAYWWG